MHYSPVHSPHKGPWLRSFEVSFVDNLKNHENKQLVARVAWWRHQMVDFPSQRPITRNKRLSKQSRRRWFQMPSRSLWHHSDGPSFQTPWRTCSGTVLRLPFSSHDPRHMFSEHYGKALIQTFIYHCNDVAWATSCLESVSTRLLFKNFILDLFYSMCNLVILTNKMCIKIFPMRKCVKYIPILWMLSLLVCC